MADLDQSTQDQSQYKESVAEEITESTKSSSDSSSHEEESTYTHIAVSETSNKQEDHPEKVINRRPEKIRLFKRKRNGNAKDPEPRPYNIWTEDDDKLLRRTYSTSADDVLLQVFPNRTKESIDQRASELGLKKTPETRANILSQNASKFGIANFADYPIEALAKKYPDLKQAYDRIMEHLLCHPAVDLSNVVQIELLKEAALHKIMQYMLMRDRIESGLKGKTLMFNPKTGAETWVETRYPHSPDITSDAKMARQILKDLGIIEEREKRVDLTGNLRLLWEDEPEEEKDADTEDKNGEEKPCAKK